MAARCYKLSVNLGALYAGFHIFFFFFKFESKKSVSEVEKLIFV